METVLVRFYMLRVEICYYGSKCYRYGWFDFECYRQVWKPATMAPNVTGICGNWVGLVLSVKGRCGNLSLWLQVLRVFVETGLVWL